MTVLQTASESKTAGWVALIVAIAGILTHPEILGLVPEKISYILSGVGIILQAITKSIAARE